MANILEIKDACLKFGERSIWHDLSLDVQQGEFIAVIGANGSGKSMLLKAILGQQDLTSGSVEFLGKPSGHGSIRIRYIPQHRVVDSGLPLKVVDAVRFGLDGHVFGLPLPSRQKRELALKPLQRLRQATWPIAQLGFFREAKCSVSGSLRQLSLDQN